MNKFEFRSNFVGKQQNTALAFEKTFKMFNAVSSAKGCVISFQTELEKSHDLKEKEIWKKLHLVRLVDGKVLKISQK